MATYAPKVGSEAAHAIAYLRSRPRGQWTPNTMLATFLGCPTNAVSPALGTALRDGIVESSHDNHRRLMWRSRSASTGVTKSPAAPVFGINWPPGFVAKLPAMFASKGGQS